MVSLLLLGAGLISLGIEQQSYASAAGQAPMPVANRQNNGGVADKSEQIVRQVAAGSCNAFLRTTNFACRYPALTTTLVVSGTLLIPPCRHYLKKKAGQLVCSVCSKVRNLLWQDVPEKMEEKLADTVKEMRKQTVTLDQLKELAKNISRENERANEQMKQTRNDIAQMDVKVDKELEDLRAINAMILELLEITKSMNRQHEEMLAGIKTVETKVDDGNARLEQKIDHNTAQVVQKIDNLSAEQKELFGAYAEQFNRRFDGLTATVAAAVTTQGPNRTTCSQSYRQKGIAY